MTRGALLPGAHRRGAVRPDRPFAFVFRDALGRSANLWPGATRWVRVPVRLTHRARRHRSTVVRFRVSASHVKAKVGKKRVRVK